MKCAIVFALAAALSGSALTQEPAASPGLDRILRVALNDERKARAFYEAVQVRFGERTPFSNIVNSEQMHMRFVEELMERHNVSVGKDNLARRPNETNAQYTKRLGVPATYREALVMAAKLEKDQGPLYDRLMNDAPEDVSAVFEKLKRDSLERHMKAFERQLARFDGGPPPGRGNRRRGVPPPKA